MQTTEISMTLAVTWASDTNMVPLRYQAWMWPSMVIPESMLLSEGHGALGPCRSVWPELLPSVVVMTRPELQLKAMSGSVALLQSVSVLISEVPITCFLFMIVSFTA